MHFAFDEEQLRFRDSVRGVLERVCAPAAVRAAWDAEPGAAAALGQVPTSGQVATSGQMATSSQMATSGQVATSGHDPARWRALAELGVLGALAPEDTGGLGLDQVALLLPLEETGRAALPEAVVETAAVAVPLLAALRDRSFADPWLARIAAGDAVVTIGCEPNPWVAHADVADLLLLARGDALHALPRTEVDVERLPHIDGAQRRFRVRWTPTERTRIAHGSRGEALLRLAVEHGALATAAQLLGVAARLVEEAVRYAKQREQFGRPIGSFQAIKHLLASAQVTLEFARPVVHRAACSLRLDVPADVSRNVSHAKIVAAEAAALAARTALQVHGAIGYTWEVDLHIWMKRAWALETAWGTSAWHRARVAAAVLDADEGASIRRSRA